MATKLSPALMSEEDDLERLRAQQFAVWRWIKVHISPPPPVHRYAGILTIKGQSLVFRGIDVRERKDFEKMIPLNKIAEVSLGLDERSKGNHNGSFVAGEPKSLVIRYRQNGREDTNYFITNFPGLSRRVDGNQYWYETLKAAINHTS